MIIGLMGKKQSGKDTAAAYLVKEHGFERRAFADPGKKYLASVLDIPLWEIEKLKNDSNSRVAIGWFRDNTHSTVTLHYNSLVFRQYMQNFIENAKLTFGEDVWANATLPVDGFYGGRAIVLSDCRFQVEVDRIKELGGYIVKIMRPSTEDQDHHRSEVEQLSIKPDRVLLNNRSVEFLYEEVNLMLDKFSEDWVG